MAQAPVPQESVRPEVVASPPRPDVGRGRLLWVDVAKALAITLVVIHHAVLFSDAAGWIPQSVVDLNAQAATVRMPLFFLASGMFAAAALARSWSVVLRRRLMFFAYLYLLWSVVRFGLFQLIPDPRTGAADGDLHALLLSPVLPGTGLWFLYALTLYSVVAKVTRPVPVVVQLIAAAALSAVAGAGMLPVESFAWRNMATYYLFFLVGAYLRPLVDGFAGAVRPVGTGVLAVVTAAAALLVHRLDLRDVPGVWLVLSVLAVAFGVAVAVQLARVPRVAAPLSALGERTLPVYLMHVPWVALVVGLVDALAAPSGAPGVAFLAVTTAFALTASLVLYRPLQRLAPWLFRLPARVA